MVPRLYAIADAELLSSRGISLREFAQGLTDAGVTLIQYRNKAGSPREILHAAEQMREAVDGTSCRIILNDRPDLALLAGLDGVHVGQDDLSPEDARRVLGGGKMIGLSTHTGEQVRAADLGVADYVAVGPVFATGTKLDTQPVIGLEGVKRARGLTSKPIVAIGGIGRGNARGVIDAGADSIAVISALMDRDESVEKVARDFLQLLR